MPNRKRAVGKPKGATLQVKVTSTSQPTTHKITDVKGSRFKGTAKVISCVGNGDTYVIPLLPGLTGAPELDARARLAGWSQWNRGPVVRFRSLAPSSSATIVTIKVLQSVRVSDMFAYPTNTFVAKYTDSFKATDNFTFTVPEIFGKNDLLSPYDTTQTASAIVIKLIEPQGYVGDVYLDFDVRLGGKPAFQRGELAIDTHGNGRIISGSRKDVILEDGAAVFTRPTVVQMDLLGEDGHGMEGAKFAKMITDTEGAIVPLSVQRERQEPTALGSRLDRVTSAILNIGERALVRWLDTKMRAEPMFRGTILLRTPQGQMSPDSQMVSAPPMKVEEPNSRGVGGLLLKVFGEVAISYVLSKALEPTKAYLARFSKQGIRHKNEHASQYIQYYAASNNSSPDGDHPGGDSQVPDKPDFGGDIEAPGTEVDFIGSQQFLSSYIVGYEKTDNAYCRSSLATKFPKAPYFKPPILCDLTGKRMPWDNELKMYAGGSIQVDTSLNGYWLLLEGYCWGDNAAVRFNPSTEGAVYLGTASTFAGVCATRSVVGIRSADDFNRVSNNILIGMGKFLYQQSDDDGISGSGCSSSLAFYKLGAVKLRSVAETFLANWGPDSALARVHQISCLPEEVNQFSGQLPVHVDYMASRAAGSYVPNDQLDPSAPGFAENLAALTTSGGKTRAELPIKLEAGPIRFLANLAIDKSNNWYQDGNNGLRGYQLYLTQTGVASRWTWEPGMRGENDPKIGNLPLSDTTATRVVTLKPPDWLCQNTGENFICVEIVTLNMNSTLGGITDNQANYSGRASVRIQGPLSCTRVYGDASLMKSIPIVFPTDTSRIANFTPASSDYVYTCGYATAWIVGSEAVAKKWCGFGEDATGLNQAVKMYPYTLSGDLASTTPATAGPFGSLSPPYYDSSIKGDLSPGQNELSIRPMPGRRGLLTPPQEPPEPPIDWTPLEPAKEIKGFAEEPQLAKTPAPERPVIPEPMALPSHMAMTRASYSPNQSNASTDYTPFGMTGTFDMKWGKDYGSLTLTRSTKGSSNTSSSYSGDDLAAAFAVPKWEPGALRQLTIIEVIQAGTLSWTAATSTTNAKLSTATQLYAMDLFPSASNTTINGHPTNNQGDVYYGHAQPFRLLQRRIFTNKVLNQQGEISGNHTNALYKSSPRDNFILVATQVDMGDAQYGYDRILNHYSGAWYLVDYHEVESSTIYTSFGPYTEALDYVKSLLPETLEFIGEYSPFSSYMGYSISTYIPNTTPDQGYITEPTDQAPIVAGNAVKDAAEPSVEPSPVGGNALGTIPEEPGKGEPPATDQKAGGSGVDNRPTGHS